MTRDELIKFGDEAGLKVKMKGSGFVIHPEGMERFAKMVAAHEREEIIWLLSGIDQTETDAPGGWWETSTGAKFGARILEAIRARGQA